MCLHRFCRLLVVCRGSTGVCGSSDTGSYKKQDGVAPTVPRGPKNHCDAIPHETLSGAWLGPGFLGTDILKGCNQLIIP